MKAGRAIRSLSEAQAKQRRRMAGDEGFEPPVVGPEPTALPLG